MFSTFNEQPLKSFACKCAIFASENKKFAISNARNAFSSQYGPRSFFHRSIVNLNECAAATRNLICKEKIFIFSTIYNSKRFPLTNATHS